MRQEWLGRSPGWQAQGPGPQESEHASRETRLSRLPLVELAEQPRLVVVVRFPQPAVLASQRELLFQLNQLRVVQRTEMAALHDHLAIDLDRRLEEDTVGVLAVRTRRPDVDGARALAARDAGRLPIVAREF